jgi:hypothetical protein
VIFAVALVANAAEPARHPRAHVAPFTARADGLAYFGPEVARAVAAGLSSAGVTCVGDAKDAETIAGHIEEPSPDRVRLIALVRGRTVQAEGPLESIDTVAHQLAQRIAPIMQPKEPIHAAPPAQAVRVEKPPESIAPPKPEEKEISQPAPPKETTPAPAAAPKPAADEEEERIVTSPPPAPKLAGPPVPSSQPAAPVAPAPAPYYSYAHPRVVAHAVVDLPSSFSGSGSSATQAFYYFLRARLRLQVIPTGYGVAPPQIAADEAWRAGARAAVMLRLTDIQYLPGPGGMSVRCQLEVDVVRDGRLIMRRYIASLPTDLGPAGLRRGREMDPIFQAVLQSLDSIQSDLAAATL